ncbi:MAG TPA: nitroreductase/quinone reductase family protein [Chloroflexia bacterium]|nr:nitroreductase/quinone reductase family protein [Chloroflexia bacterium]
MASQLNHRAVHFFDVLMRRVYLLTKGLIGHHLFGWTFLLLTTTGRKSGLARIHTLVYLREAHDLLIVASNNGADAYPAWYLNLSAQPRVLVQTGRRKGIYCARTATPEERQILWPKLVAYHKPFEHHQQKTAREIPIVILTPGTC